MSAELLFTISNVAVLPGWALLIFAPQWKWSARLICPVLLPLALALLYGGILVSQWRGLEGGFGSLSEVARLFEHPYALLAGWVHYLAFDLFVGSWQVRDAQQLNIRHRYIIPCLLLTLFFGPVGLLLYLALRYALKRQFEISR